MGFKSKLSEALPGNHIKWASLGSVRNSRFASGFTPLQPKPLDSLMDLERAKTKSPEELTSIWDDYHLGRGHIGITMKAQLYRLLEQRASECRYFVIPLWRGNGYITMFAQGSNSNLSFHGYIKMFAQVQAPHMIFTGLEDYKARGTQASPYLTTTFYTELSETKDLVFIRGDVVFTSKLTDEEAKWIMETAQSFYLNDTRYSCLSGSISILMSLSSRMCYKLWICLFYNLLNQEKNFPDFEFLRRLVLELLLYG